MIHANLGVYLDALKAALKGSDKALIQDALWDAEDHLRSELARRRAQDPKLDIGAALTEILAAYGEPAEVAAAYRDRDRLVAAALAPVAPSAPSPEDARESASRPHPSFFGVFKDLRAYTSLFYLLLSLATGIFFFTWAVVGLSLSMGLMVLIIGIPVLIAFLGSVRLLALAEGRLVEALLGVRMPRRQPPIEEEKGWKSSLKRLFCDGRTWSSLLYLLLMLPLGVFFFSLMVTMLSTSLALLATPVVHFVFHEVTYDGWTWGGNHPALVAIVAGLLGLIAVPITLHASLLLGRMQGFLARHFLVRV
ncbi:MAG: sensor domain-containing protein [Acidobacteria bacterium]|nr:sensor domain-containing protein [Acidobacteriota bacterium]